MRLLTCLLLVATACARRAPPSPVSFEPPSGVCPTKLHAPGQESRTVALDGRSRSYVLHVPPAASSGGPLPLVLGFHGGMGDGDGFLESSGLAKVADREGFLVAAPEGSGMLQTWNAGNCCGAAKREAVDDVRFVRALVSEIAKDNCVDPQRIYATGHSNGAMMSYRLACEASDLIAAIAAVGGAMGHLDRQSDPPREIFSCRPTRPVPILHLHGLADGCYRFEGGVGNGLSGTNFVGVPESLAIWRAIDGCSDATRTTYERGAARCVRNEGCEADVELCTDDAAGHNWLGSSTYFFASQCGGRTTTDLDANEQLWRFFVEHPKR